MKKKLAAMVMAAMAIAAVAAGPASADEDWNERGHNGHYWNDRDHDDVSFGYPYVAFVEDVEYENVRERNNRDGDCFVDDIDLDGYIAEYELVCYY